MESETRSERFSELPLNYASKNSCIKTVGRQTVIGDSTNVICALAFDPEGNRLAVAELDGSLRIYSPTTGKM